MHCKSLTIVVIFQILPYLCKGQSEKGDNYFGISGLPVYWFNGNNIESYGFIIKSYLGKPISSKFSIGIQPYYANISDINTAGINFFSRYNLLAKRVLVFLEGSTGFGVVEYNNSTLLNHGLFSLSMGPGMSYFVNKTISIDLIFQYQQWTVISENTKGSSFVPSIGVILYLNSVCKKTGKFLQNELLLMRFLFYFYEVMPEYQSIRKKLKYRNKKHF